MGLTPRCRERSGRWVLVHGWVCADCGGRLHAWAPFGTSHDPDTEICPACMDNTDDIPDQ